MVLKAKPTAIAIIQARLSSQRLPGKVLMPLGSTPMISEIYSRALMCSNVDKVIVATSNETSDDALANYCNKSELNVYRGSLDNVLSRFTGILEGARFDYVVRVTGDCPLIHPPFIDAQIEALNKYDGDLIFSNPECSVLAGQGVMSSRALLHVSQKTADPIDFEHVGSKYFIDHADEFRYVQLNIPDYFTKQPYRLYVDEPEDYHLIDQIFSMTWDHSSPDLLEVINWLNQQKKDSLINKNVTESLVNQEINLQKDIFKPSVIGAVNWIK
jgi:spore coat polysaccharide biosynthesis protein SpsF